MISRRSVRIKVAQSLYSQMIVGELNAETCLKAYNVAIGNIIKLNLAILLYIREIFEFSEKHYQQESEKFANANREIGVSTQILQSRLYDFLKNNEHLQKYFKKYKAQQYLSDDLIKNLYELMVKLQSYKEYNQNPTEENAVTFELDFFKKVLFCHEDLDAHLEYFFEDVEEDMDLIHFSLRREILKNAKSQGGIYQISLGMVEWRNETEFATDLINAVINNNADFDLMIKPKLTGWDSDRIPVIDLVLIKMGMAEMLYFESIPVKVSINEYVDLAKIFTSPKSKIFINGILDRFMKEWTEEEKIHKTGRGLVDKETVA